MCPNGGFRYFTGEVTESPRKNIFNDVSTAIAEVNGTLFKIMVGSDGAACYMGAAASTSF